MKELAEVIRKAAEIREKSWDESEGRIPGYAVSIHNAVRSVTEDADLRTLACILLTTAWNDVIFWADGYKLREEARNKVKPV